MKRLLMIIGIVFIVACVFSLLFALWNRFGYYHVLDGSAELYSSLHRRMIVFLIVGIVLAVLGAVCLVIRSKT